MENNIFNQIDRNSNLIISELDSNDLMYLLLLILDSNLEYKDLINTDYYNTIGLELEFENIVPAAKNIIFHYLNKDDLDWDVKEDGSLIRGLEVTSPILRDEKKSWIDLRNICLLCKKCGSIYSKAGSHIHIGSQILGNNYKYWINFLKLWFCYENVITRYTNGEYLNNRYSLLEYARPIRNLIKYIFNIEVNSLKELIMFLQKDRHQMVNFLNVEYDTIEYPINKNTIEFRGPNGTLEHTIWQNNINLFIKLLEYSKSNNYNYDLINKRFNEINNLNYNLYNEIYLDQSIELCDLIFDNNLDKVNFLIQYLKHFETSDKLQEKGKSFIK